ncbi:hypothetical protein jhhlp_003529 [Lomentospora prolificans]|uniref:Protein kinase domain-containing protein n=1 Tax=Lomentospora prolificans TaxID=41688 RepID=A0A2N3N8Z9_9PEZI|nr:hypothetical protein jhhlp_003529 [Lomentospora prolificans]
MAQANAQSPVSPTGTTNFLRRLLFGYGSGTPATGSEPNKSPKSQYSAEEDGPQRTGLIRRVSRKVVPGLPRMQTFKRQQSEKRINLAPVQPTPAERRAVSVDRRAVLSRTTSRLTTDTLPRSSAPDFLDTPCYSSQDVVASPPVNPDDLEWQNDSIEGFCRLDTEAESHNDFDLEIDTASYNDEKSQGPWPQDAESITTSQIQEELETTWILNLSMHFRDKSNREKFFVTYREQCETEVVWRRVTISLDYRKAPDDSLEMELMRIKFQRDKSAKIYEAIRDSLSAIRFYDTVTNLKLQTTEGRLHVHVAEDLNEVITYPAVREVHHLRCRRIRERDIVFDSHMSGFVYKVHVGGQVLIKKEIPGPDTINEFIYEINALYTLQYSSSVITFFGVVVDNQDEHVKGLLISYAERGPLMDILYDHRPDNDQDLPRLPFATRATWAKQVVQGLADIHESGFVQGDFTLSNIVIDGGGSAKIIDINRRGCPVGWEPPEARPLLKSSQGISMYIGVKSDLYQLGMVLWALAMEDDEPEKYGPRLALGPDVDVPPWYRRIVEICLSEEPRMRLQATSLLCLFPSGLSDGTSRHIPRSPSEYGDHFRNPYASERGHPSGIPEIRAVSPSDRWTYTSFMNPADIGYVGYEAPYAYPPRGRSPPSPLPSNFGQYDMYRTYRGGSRHRSADTTSYSDDAGRGDNDDEKGSVDLPPKEEEDGEEGNSTLSAPRTTASVGAGEASLDTSGRCAAKNGTGLEMEDSELRRAVVGDGSEEVAMRNSVVATATIQADACQTSGETASVETDFGEVENPDVEAGPTENVGRTDDTHALVNGLGILPATGITEPNGRINGGGEDTEMALAPSVPGKSGESAGPTEPGEQPLKNRGRDAAVVISTDDDESGTRRGIDTDPLAAKTPATPLAHDQVAPQRSIPIQTPRGRSPNEDFSILTGVGGADDDAEGAVSEFPTSLIEDDLELALAPFDMSTTMQGREEIPVTAVIDVKDG